MDDLKRTEQYAANLKLVLKMSELIQQNPNLRFGQILQIFGFVNTIKDFEEPSYWECEFYKPSENILERVKNTWENQKR